LAVKEYVNRPNRPLAVKGDVNRPNRPAGSIKVNANFMTDD
jgi:hypothetical protein